MKNQAGFISIILTVLITALLVGGGTYVLVEQQAEKQVTKAVQETSQNVQQQAQVQIDQLNEKLVELEGKIVKEKEEKANLPSGWRTYYDSDGMFSFSYPINWSIDKIRSTDNKLVFNTGFLESRESIMVEESTETLIKIQEDFIKTFDVNAVEKVVKINIDNHDAYRININEFGLDYILTKKDDKLYTFTTQGLMENNGILDTFKFLDDDTADWQTYTNEKQNFAFKYPSDWHIISNGEFGMSAGDAIGDMPVMILKVNPDGFGPFFPNKTFMIKKSNGSLVVIEEIEHDNNKNQVSGTYQIIAREDANSGLPSFWMSFTDNSGNEEVWDKIVKEIITSLVLLD